MLSLLSLIIIEGKNLYFANEDLSMVTEIINEPNSNQKQSNFKAHTLTILHAILQKIFRIFRKIEPSLNCHGYKNKKMSLNACMCPEVMCGMGGQSYSSHCIKIKMFIDYILKKKKYF